MRDQQEPDDRKTKNVIAHHSSWEVVRIRFRTSTTGLQIAKFLLVVRAFSPWSISSIPIAYSAQ